MFNSNFCVPFLFIVALVGFIVNCCGVSFDSTVTLTVFVTVSFDNLTVVVPSLFPVILHPSVVSSTVAIFALSLDHL